MSEGLSKRFGGRWQACQIVAHAAGQSPSVCAWARNDTGRLKLCVDLLIDPFGAEGVDGIRERLEGPPSPSRLRIHPADQEWSFSWVRGSFLDPFD
jgi:hypothetical protein